MYLQNIYSFLKIKNFHGRDAGKPLVKDAIQKARLKSYKTIEVGTGNSSVGQLALYQKYGFKITSIDEDFFGSHYTEKVIENGIQCQDMIRLSQNFKIRY